MVSLKYKDLTFGKAEQGVRVVFLKIYYFYLHDEDLLRIGPYRVYRHSMSFRTGKKVQNVEQKFNFLLKDGFESLRSTVNNKPALYVHRASGIPLIGSNEFGIIDRGTNTIEVKPITTCNIDCIFCSVDHLQRGSDVVVETDYLAEELNKVIAIKRNRVNIHIGSQGDPSLYGNLVYLVKRIRENKKVAAISMVTNGILITKPIVDKLVKAGMTHFHISLHSTNKEMADRLANAPYPVKRVMELCEYIVSKAHLLIVPVWVPGINDKDIEDVIIFAKRIGADIGIQNFLEYRFGKHPVNPLPMKVFYSRLSLLEQKLGVNLTSLDPSLEFRDDAELEKPFKKGDAIIVESKAPSRLKNAMIGVAQGRVVTIVNCRRTGNMKVRIVRDKHNIFVAK